ncbi:MAG: sensor histidine kinase [bacterium]
MTAAVPHPSIEPLFAHNARLWLRIWVVTQAAAIVVALYVSVDGAGGIAPLLASPRFARLVAIVFALVAYHAAGYLAHGWILRRTWALLLYVPISWVLIVFALGINGAFSLLLLGAIIEGFIFLPFNWAAALLAIAVVTIIVLTARQSRVDTPTLRLMRAGIVLATGVMIGTVLLYIHRANREAALRTRLLAQLDAAQRDLADRARSAGVLEERQRFARDIHDTLAQGFASVIRHLEAVELSLGESGTAPAAEHDAARLARVMPHLRHAQEVSRSSLGEIRHLVHALRPAELEESHLAAAIERYVTGWGASNTIRTTSTLETLPALQPDADVIFLRATQEALSNVARHAHAQNVSVSIGCVDGLVLLTVEDDGCGFAQADSVGAEQLGLSGMRERVRRFGGHLLVDSALGTGTSLTVALPLSAVAAVPPPLTGRGA